MYELKHAASRGFVATTRSALVTACVICCGNILCSRLSFFHP